MSNTRIAEPAKEKVSTLDLAEHLCGPGQLRRMGKEFVARCPLPNHQDKTPSFTVNPVKNVFFCHGCLRGGDVIELARFAWGYEKHEVAMAAADLLREFGYEIPTRPASWFRKQKRQRPVRSDIEAAKILVARRRLYRRFFEPLVLASTNPEDREHDAQLFWEATGPLAEDLVGAMISREER